MLQNKKFLCDIHLTSQISDRLDKAELKVKTDVHNYGKKVQEATVRVSLLNTGYACQ